jgi:co-chaperonin GroES (HSP10)
MAVNIQPLGDRVLVQPVDEKEVKKGGLRGTGLAIGLVREEEEKARKSKAKEMDKTKNKDSSRLRGTGIK